jgi:hypothetical protein
VRFVSSALSIILIVFLLTGSLRLVSRKISNNVLICKRVFYPCIVALTDEFSSASRLMAHRASRRGERASPARWSGIGTVPVPSDGVGLGRLRNQALLSRRVSGTKICILVAVFIGLPWNLPSRSYWVTSLPRVAAVESCETKGMGSLTF